jgi:hypothetical protein
MRRKAAISAEGAERIRWYAEMQQQMFANPPEPQISDDEDDDHETSSETGTMSTQSSLISSSKQPDIASFQSFATSLVAESTASKELFSKTSSSTKISTEKPLTAYPPDILNKALIRLNSPHLVRFSFSPTLIIIFRASLVCLLGFNDNGLCLSNYGEHLANYDIELVSFVFPGITISSLP